MCKSLKSKPLKFKTLKYKDVLFKVREDGKVIYANNELLNINQINPNGIPYFKVCFATFDYYVHKLVALTYLPKILDFVIHKNGDTENNSFKNLRWITKEEKGQRTIARNKSSKFTLEEAKAIAVRLDNGEFGTHIAKEFSVHQETIRRIRRKYSKKPAPSQAFPEEVKRTVLKLLKKYSAYRVAIITGINSTTVTKWKNQNKL